MQNEISAEQSEERFPVRRLEIADKSKGFIELLQQLSVCDSVSEEEFRSRFQELKSHGDDHVICVIEDDRSGKIIATGSVFVEKKFLRNCGKVGHIEDVVVDSSARGMKLGQKIVSFLTDHARSVGCYKVILDCSVENKGFYEKCGFKQKEIQMVRKFSSSTPQNRDKRPSSNKQRRRNSVGKVSKENEEILNEEEGSQKRELPESGFASRTRMPEMN